MRHRPIEITLDLLSQWLSAVDLLAQIESVRALAFGADPQAEIYRFAGETMGALAEEYGPETLRAAVDALPGPWLDERSPLARFLVVWKRT